MVLAADNYDAIVVGAGPGGAACAALLAKRGLKALLVEKNDRPGGKAMTISNRGFTYELWPVAGGPRLNSQFEVVLKELGLESERTDPDNIFTFYYRSPSGEYTSHSTTQPQGSGEQDQTSALQLISWLELLPEDLTDLARFGADVAALTSQEIEALDEITYHEFLSRYQIPQPMYSFLAAQMNVVFVLPIDQLAASEGVKTLREMTTDGAGFYYKGGYGRLFEKYVEAFRRDGGVAIFGTRVERVIIQEGQVEGVVTDQGIFHAPIVISNVGIQPTVLKLAGVEHFDKSYVNYVKDLVPSLGLMGIRYFLNRPVLKTGAHIAFSDDSYWNVERSLKAKRGNVPDELLIFATVPSCFDPDLAPAGKQCVLASTLCPSDPEMKDTQGFWDKMDEMMDKIWPGFSQHIESKEQYGTQHVSALTRDYVLPGIGGECIGLGQVVGQCGRHKPSAKAPVRGLFYVGCDAGGYGCGTHQAVDSAVKVARLVHQYYQMH
jgi:prolycopene isomerase